MEYQLKWLTTSIVAFFVLTAISATTLVIYRLCLSPLAEIPGPKLAAATGWYEFYYDCLLAGKYIFEIERMHNNYGPIVRISPHEVHIKDSGFFLRLNSTTSKLDKYAWYYNFIAAPLSGATTTSHEVHRTRRAAVAKFFSTANVARLEPLIQSCVSKLISRLDEHRRQGKIADLSNAYRCLATDIITEYALPRSRLMLDSPNFAADYNRVLRNFAHIATWNRHVPIIFPIFNIIPRSVIARLDPGPSLAVFDNQKFFEDSAAQVAASHGQSTDLRGVTVLHDIYNSDLQTSEQSVPRLTQEAQTLIGAGTETTGNTLSVITFHLLSDRRKAYTLKEELQVVHGSLDEVMTFQDLQKLPYLTAVISEGLRIGSSVSGRLPRVNPSAAMEYKSYVIPAGTAVSITIRDVLYDDSIFPNAHLFKPERWLGDEKRALEKYLIPFSKGPRSCVGMNLALAELYLVIGNLFRRFEMELFDTKEEDMAMAHDFFSPFGPADSKGLRVAVL